MFRCPPRTLGALIPPSTSLTHEREDQDSPRPTNTTAQYSGCNNCYRWAWYNQGRAWLTSAR